MIFTLTLNPSLDRYLYVSQLIEDDTVRVSEIKDYPAGKGVDVSRVINELEGHSVSIMITGGENGSRLCRMLDEEGVVYASVLIPEETRMNVIIQEPAKQYRLSMKGPEVPKIDIEKILKTIKTLIHENDYLILTGTPPSGVKTDIYRRISDEICSEKNITVYLDADKEAFKLGLQGKIKGIKPNSHELSRLIGRELNNENEYIPAVKEVAARYDLEEVLLTLGKDGAICFIKGEIFKVNIPKVPVKSAVGAGDSFLGAYCMYREKGENIINCLKMAAAASSAAVMTEGTSLCEYKDVMNLKKEVSVVKL